MSHCTQSDVSCERFLSAWKAWGRCWVWVGQTWVRSSQASLCTRKHPQRRSRNLPLLEEAQKGTRGQGCVCPSSGSEAPAGGGLLRVPWSCLGAPVEFGTERKAPETFLCTEVPRPVRRALPWERGSKSRPQPGPSRRTSRATGFHQGQQRSHMGKQTEQTAVTPGQVESPCHGDGGRPA